MARRLARLGTSATVVLFAAFAFIVPSAALTPTVPRVGGGDAIGTALAISQAVIADHSVDSVLLADADDLSNAVGGGAATGAFPTPVPLLFTHPGSLDAQVSAEIDRVLPTGTVQLAEARVFMLGPTLSGAVSASVAGKGVVVERLSGANPAATTARLAGRLFPGAGPQRTVALVPPGSWPAAAAASAMGSALVIPVLLAGVGDAVPAETAAYLTDARAGVVLLVGDAGAISEAQEHAIEDLGISVRRASGGDPSTLSAQVASTWANTTLFRGSALRPVLAGLGGPAGGALAAALFARQAAPLGAQSPLLLVPAPPPPGDPGSACLGAQGRGPICYLLGTGAGPLTAIGDASMLSDAAAAYLNQARLAPRYNYVPNFSHIFVVVMENENYADAFGPGGRTKAPYFNSLADGGSQGPSYFGIDHMSLPNYIGMVSGIKGNATTEGDCPQYNCIYPDNTLHLGDQLDATKRNWKAYMDGMSGPCQHPAEGGPGDNTFFATPTSEYATRHNPWMYFGNMIHNPVRCAAHDVPYAQLAADLSSNHVPDFAFIVPDLCHDGHDNPCHDGSSGGISRADSWASTEVPKILASPAYQQGGALFVTFDEAVAPPQAGADSSTCCGNPTGGGRVGMIIRSGAFGREAGFEGPTPANHYSLLRTIETAWGLAPLASAGDPKVYPMSEFFTPAAQGSVVYAPRTGGFINSNIPNTGTGPGPGQLLSLACLVALGGLVMMQIRRRRSDQ